MFRVVDDGDPPMSDAETVAMSVGDVNWPPIMEPMRDYTIQEGETVSFEVAASDPDGDSLAYEMTDGPESATFVDQTFQWAPAVGDAAMPHSANFRVDDGKGLADTMTVNIRVNTEVFPVFFPDPNLEAVIREYLDIPAGALMKSDVMRLSYINGADKNITSIEGLEHCENLQNITIDSNQISDLGPLTGLVHLQYLSLAYNQIIDLRPLAGLLNLQNLGLQGNQISDLQPISDLRPIRYLHNRPFLNVMENPLDTNSCALIIPKLQTNGFWVFHNCP
jgi:hypothetical protein